MLTIISTGIAVSPASAKRPPPAVNVSVTILRPESYRAQEDGATAVGSETAVVETLYASKDMRRVEYRPHQEPVVQTPSPEPLFDASPNRGLEGQGHVKEDPEREDEKDPELKEEKIPKQENEQTTRLPDYIELTSDSEDDLELLDGPKLNAEQQHVVDLIMQGRNVFYTGSAGCGKSTVLQAAVRQLRKTNKNVHVLAPTGKAALGVGGETTWSYLGWVVPDRKSSFEKLVEDRRDGRKNRFTRKRIRETHVVIIDEISMVENHFLERMNRFMKAVRDQWVDEHLAKPFGGVQLVVSGDFCQMPPVQPLKDCPECGLETAMREDGLKDCQDKHGPWDNDEKWAFKSSAWEECKFVPVNLKEIHRQSDASFIKMLQKRRLGVRLTSSQVDLLMDHPCDVIGATHIFPKKDEVRALNDKMFNRLKTPIQTYRAVDACDSNGNDYVERHLTAREKDGTLTKLADHRFESEVQLRLGMHVVLLTNLDVRNGLVNGSVGVICGFEPFDPHKLPKAAEHSSTSQGRDVLYGEHAELMERAIRKYARDQQNPSLVWPRVRFLDNLKRRVIYPHCAVETIGAKRPYVLLHRTQLPLMPAWAMTIHKAQGMTLNRVIVDLASAFEDQQVYVALSRARTLDGLQITGGRHILEQQGGTSEAVRAFLVEAFGDEILDIGE
jgi:ATP-dependent DNA helicase PIF1